MSSLSITTSFLTGSMREAEGRIPVPPPPPPPSVTQMTAAYILPGKMSLGDISVPSPNTIRLSGPFHAKSGSVTESINSESYSEQSTGPSEQSTGLSEQSTGSFPSSGTRKNGSEADSERDSVSPQRILDEVNIIITVLV